MRSVAELEAIVRNDPDVHDYQRSLGDAYTHFGRLLIASDIEEAERLLGLALKIRQKLVEDNPSDAAFRFNAAANLCSLAGCYDDSLTLFQCCEAAGWCAQQAEHEPDLRKRYITQANSWLGQAIKQDSNDSDWF